jgi:hypothetical protein
LDVSVGTHAGLSKPSARRAALFEMRRWMNHLVSVGGEGVKLVVEAFDIPKVASEIALRFYLTIGFVALLGLAALAATSTDGMVRRLGGRRWQRLHRLVYLIVALGLRSRRCRRLRHRACGAFPRPSRELWPSLGRRAARSIDGRRMAIPWPPQGARPGECARSFRFRLLPDPAVRVDDE